MTVNEILCRFVQKRHVPIMDMLYNGVEQKFITCFDINGNEISLDEVQEASPQGTLGEVDYFTPTPGVGYYAHLRLAGSGAGEHGASTRYEIAAPDWQTVAHVTEPSSGGAPDIIVESFAETPGARKFADGVAARH